MYKETRKIINVIKSAITNEKIEISEKFPFKKLLEYSIKHNIFAMIYSGLNVCDVTLDDSLEKYFNNMALRGVYISVQQMYYLKEITRLFENENIDYMLLKGGVLKELYIKPEIRRMGDIDILIKEEQYEIISKVFKSLGFTFRNESNHEIVWVKDCIVVELHKILMPSYNIDLHSYFGNGWKRAVKVSKNKYTFSDDDMFIYLFSHFAKHFRDSGIGITHMCDLYVFLKNKQINEIYIEKELKVLQLYDFYCNIKETLDVWFENKESSEITDYITKVIFNSGAYGLSENTVISSALKARNKYNNVILGRINRIWCTIFPSYNSMKTRYFLLKKFPVLLPYYWVSRWIRLLVHNKNDITSHIGNICYVNEQQIKDYKKGLNYVGLDYNF